MLWPAVTLLGFLLLTAFVVAMGTTSTARYEAEKRAASVADAPEVTADGVPAMQAA